MIPGKKGYKQKLNAVSELCDGFDEELFNDYKSVMSEIPGETSVTKMKIKVEDGIKVISQRPYRVPDKLKDDLLLESNIIEPSESAWASPCVPIVKSDGKVRLCVDY